MNEENPQITITSNSHVDIFSLINFEKIVHTVIEDIFCSMISLPLEYSPINHELPGPVINGTIEFNGVVAGQIHVHVPRSFAVMIASAMTSMEPDELDDEMVSDTIGEVTNMISGNLKTDLCNSGLECALKVPKVTHVECAPILDKEEGTSLSFSNGTNHLNITICLKKQATV